MAHVDINVRILANRCKLQPSGVFRHFGYFRRYRPMAHWKVVLIKHILQHLSRPTPNPPPPYNYWLLLRLCNCSICAQDSTIPWFCWPFVIGHGTPSTQLDGHVVFDFSDREWLHWNRMSWMQWWTMPAVPGGYKHSFCLCGKLHLDLPSFLTELWMFSNQPFWNMLC